MKTYASVKRIHLRFFTLILLALLLSACGGDAERLWLNAPGWKRAQQVGSTYTDYPTSIALNGEEGIYVLLVDQMGGRYRPHLIFLNRQVESVWDNALTQTYASIDQPRILWDGRFIQLFWISEHRLINAQIDTTGDLVREPEFISGDVLVSSYDVAIDPEDNLTLWYEGQEETPGIYALPPGDFIGSPTQVDPLGLSPDITYTEDGTLHVIWWHDIRDEGDNRIFYGTYPDGDLGSGQEFALYEQALRSTDGFEGPYLGIDQTHGYVLWTLSERTGLEAGKIEASYIRFPLNDPEAVSPPRAISVPTTYNLNYLPDGNMVEQTGLKVPLNVGMIGGTSVINSIDVQPLVGSELTVAARVRVEYKMRKEENQIGMIFFRDGDPFAYQLINFTAADSRHPNVIRDSEGYLYLTWHEVENEGRKVVYFSSTAPDIRASIGTLTGDDLRRVGVDTLFGMLTGALMTPFALIWLIAPLIMLALTSFTRKEAEGLTGKGTLISLALSLLAFWVSKLIIMPTLWDYVPFSTWIPIIPEGLYIPLRIGVPIVIALIALLVAWNYTYRRQRNSVLFFTLVYVGLDGILTMAIYGVVILAAI